MNEIDTEHLDDPVASTGVRPQNRQPDTTRIGDPVFILVPPRSFSSVGCAMIGQHPQMHGLPETHLFCDETMAQWWKRSSQAMYPMADGLVRAVAQLCFGEQNETTVNMARGWLRRRSHLTTGHLFEALLEKAHPLILLEKSPSTVHYPESLQRVFSFFPRAKFIHLLRHPRGQGESVMKYIADRAQYGSIPLWLQTLASFPDPFASEGEMQQSAPDIDPQKGWYVLNRNISEFLEGVPHEQKLQVRGEDLLSDPDHSLRRIAGWLGIRTDQEAIDEMKHPERSPYAGYGPAGARYGNDAFFLRSPALGPSRFEEQSLEGPLSWRQDGQGFRPEVKQLAQQFGYQ